MFYVLLHCSRKEATDAWETHCLDQDMSDEGEKERDSKRQKEAALGEHVENDLGHSAQREEQQHRHSLQLPSHLYSNPVLQPCHRNVTTHCCTLTPPTHSHFSQTHTHACLLPQKHPIWLVVSAVYLQCPSDFPLLLLHTARVSNPAECVSVHMCVCACMWKEGKVRWS